jgi:hypothetical protein
MFPEAEQPAPEEQTPSREAYLLSLEQGPDAARHTLSGKSDPESVASPGRPLAQAGFPA